MKNHLPDIDQWRPKALKFAKSLRGRERTPTEKKFRENHPDYWDYFRVFGIQEETQAYIDETIRQIENLEPDNYADQLVVELRLGWSAEKLGRKR